MRLTIRLMMMLVFVAAYVCFLILDNTVALSIGHVVVPLDFSVIDRNTGRPINAVNIKLAERTPEYRLSTGSDGRASVRFETHFRGRSTAFHRSRVRDFDCELAVTAAGCKPLRRNLSEYTLARIFHESERPPPIVIQLEELPPGQ